MGLYPQPASVAVLKGLWLPEHQVWTESWLRMLRCQSAETVEAWQLLRRKELAQAVERERLNSISRFYTGRELQKLLHPRTPAPHSPQLYTNIPGTIVVTGDARSRDAFAAGLPQGYILVAEAHNSTRVVDLSPADLGMALSLAEERGLTVQLVQGPKRLVTSSSSRLCAWEFDLANEALAKRACCTRCGGRALTPVTRIEAENRSVQYWCAGCASFRSYRVSVEEYASLFFCTDGIPRAPLHGEESLRGAITADDWDFLLEKQPRRRAPGQDMLPFELLQCTSRLKQVALECINGILTGEALPPRSWLGGLVRFLLKKEDVFDTGGYRPVCLLDTIYKCLSAIVTDRLYRLAERYGLLDPSQEGFRRLHSTQRQVQSLHWAVQEAAERREKLFCVYLDFRNAFNSIDHEALWRWLKELNIPDVDLLQSLYSGAYYTADLPYGRSAEVILSRGQKQGDKSSPLLFGLVFNALLLALKATGVGHRTITGLRAPARGFADDLALVTKSEADMVRLLQVVSRFCTWSGMRINVPKSVATGFDFAMGRDLPTEGIQYEGSPLPGLAADEAFTYLGVRASLVCKKRRRCTAPCLTEEKAHVFAVTKDLVSKARRHKYLLCQMVPAMHMVATSRFRYSAPLVPWRDAELDKLHAVWLQVERAAWRLPPGYASAPLLLPSRCGGCPVAHPKVIMVQALAKHIEQLVALPDELRETTVRRFKRLCDKCGCHNEGELAAYLAEERQPRACPLACFLRLCGQLKVPVKLPACISLAVAGRDVSWYALRVHLQATASDADTSDQQKSDVATVTESWPAIRRRFRSKGVCCPRQLLVDPRASPVVWLVPNTMSRNPHWLEPLRRALSFVDARRLFPRLHRTEGAPRAAEHQALLHDVLRGLKDPEAPIEPLFADERWNRVSSSAPQQSWLAALRRHGFPCAALPRTDPVQDLVGIGQFAGAEREVLLPLTIWLASTLRSKGTGDARMADRGPLTWAPIQLSTERVVFDTSCLEGTSETHGGYVCTAKDSVVRIERDGHLRALVNQGRFKFLAAECVHRNIDIEFLCEGMPAWVSHVEKHESSRGYLSHQFGHGLRVALDLDGIIGCCPLVAPSSFPYSSWDGVSADWGYSLLPNRPIFVLLCSSPEEQGRLARLMAPGKVWFALTRKSTLHSSAEIALRQGAHYVTVFKQGSRVAACKGSYRTGKLKAIKSRECWLLWASKAAVAAPGCAGSNIAPEEEEGDSIHREMMEAQVGLGFSAGSVAETLRVSERLTRRAELVSGLKRRLERLQLTADGVVPLDPSCLSSREAVLGPAGHAYSLSGLVAATDGSLKKNGSMGAAYVSIGGRLPPRSVSVFGQPSSIRPELTGIAMVLKDCPDEEDLNILTDSLSAIVLLRSMHRKDLPLWLYRHTARQLLQHTAQLVNRRAEMGRTTRFIKVKAHRGEPLNEAADALAAAAAETDPARDVELDLDPEAVHFLFKGKWVEWDMSFREDLTQKAAEQCLSRILRPKRRRGGQEAAPPALPLTASWMLRPDQGRSTLGQVLKTMKIGSAKKQVLQSVAGAFPCNALLHKWGMVSSAACALCGAQAETQSHIQCLCPALKDARIRAHHNLAHRLWKGISDASKKFHICVEQTVDGLRGLPQPEDQIKEWQQALDELTDVQLEVQEEDTEGIIQRKRPDAWAVSWGGRCLLIMEFTRPNDRGELSLHETDALKTARYTPLRDLLASLLPKWEVSILTFSLGIRGSYTPDRWTAQLNRLGLAGARVEKLMEGMVSQALTELTAIYSTRYAAIQHKKAQDE